MCGQGASKQAVSSLAARVTIRRYRWPLIGTVSPPGLSIMPRGGRPSGHSLLFVTECLQCSF